VLNLNRSNLADRALNQTLNELIERAEPPGKNYRQYLGASAIGDDCLRKVPLPVHARSIHIWPPARAPPCSAAPALKAARCRILAAMVFRAAAARWAPTGQEDRLAPEVIELIKRTDRIKAQLDAVIKEADRTGQPWPNGKDLERTAGRQLRGNGLEVTNEEIHPFAKDEKYKAKRRPRGFH
jgi:hypothetical protein